MPAIKCPYCGHRHFQLVACCINCGEPLSAPYPPQLPDKEVPASVVISSAEVDDNDEEVAEYERFLAESRREESSRLIVSAEKAPVRSSSGPSERKLREKGLQIPKGQPDAYEVQNIPQEAQTDDAAARQLIRRQSAYLARDQSWRNQRGIQPYEIYETAFDIVPPETFSAPGSRSSGRGPEQSVDPEFWKADKLPWYFPRTRPKVAGTVVLIETKEEILDYPDLYAAIATLLVELIWVLAQVQQEKETGSRVVMTVVRVQSYDGTLSDTRIRGNMRGANVSLGDQISLWGKKRNGVLYVRRGFNHTTQGVISTYSLGLMLPALIVVVAFIAGFYFAPIWLPSAAHHLWPSLDAFFNFWIKHSLTAPAQK
jgi:hypothetical protein